MKLKVPKKSLKGLTNKEKEDYIVKFIKGNGVTQRSKLLKIWKTAWRFLDAHKLFNKYLPDGRKVKRNRPKKLEIQAIDYIKNNYKVKSNSLIAKNILLNYKIGVSSSTIANELKRAKLTRTKVEKFNIKSQESTTRVLEEILNKKINQIYKKEGILGFIPVNVNLFSLITRRGKKYYLYIEEVLKNSLTELDLKILKRKEYKSKNGYIQRLLSELLKNLFPKESILFESYPDFLQGLEYDIYFPERKLAIEVQGGHHFEKRHKEKGTQKRDKTKVKLSLQNNITLITVNTISKYHKDYESLIKLFENLKLKFHWFNNKHLESLITKKVSIPNLCNQLFDNSSKYKVFDILPDREELYTLYWVQQKTIQDIADIKTVPLHVVDRWFDLLGLEKRTNKEAQLLLSPVYGKDKEILELYSNGEGDSASKIGRKLKVSHKTIIKTLKECQVYIDSKPNPRDLIGEIFDYLTVIAFCGSENTQNIYECRCICGKTVHKSTAGLNYKRNNNCIKSCGCRGIPRIKEGYKRCSNCKNIKKHEMFVKDRHKSGGLTSACKECRSIKYLTSF